MSINWLKIYWLARVIALRNHQSIIFILKVCKEFIILRLIQFNINTPKILLNIILITLVTL